MYAIILASSLMFGDDFSDGLIRDLLRPTPGDPVGEQAAREIAHEQAEASERETWWIAGGIMAAGLIVALAIFAARRGSTPTSTSTPQPSDAPTLTMGRRYPALQAPAGCLLMLVGVAGIGFGFIVGGDTWNRLAWISAGTGLASLLFGIRWLNGVTFGNRWTCACPHCGRRSSNLRLVAIGAAVACPRCGNHYQRPPL